ncbi:MAG: hypothetical protein GY703_19280 [Gammaproteobacteria bacterium]|nr:hypothetical protein [Gammaproteobacteria bacterium]
MDKSNAQPSLFETIGAVTDVQLHRYNTATKELMKHSVARWSREMSTPEKTVHPYFIQVGLQDIEDPEEAQFFNRIPTSFSLSDEQVDRLVAKGKELFLNHPDYQQLIEGLNAPAPGS